jgi:hypothetical protein
MPEPWKEIEMVRWFSMRRASVLAAVVALGLVTVFILQTGAASADSPGDEGDPALTADAPLGYYLWHDDAGNHLRTHGPGAEHLFVARLHTDGQFVDVTTVRGEGRDDVAILDGGHTLLLRVHTFDGTDGVDFRVQGGTSMRVRLELDRELIGTDSIFLGAARANPESNPFTLPQP